jgi:hypothetical protein
MFLSAINSCSKNMVCTVCNIISLFYSTAQYIIFMNTSINEIDYFVLIFLSFNILLKDLISITTEDVRIGRQCQIYYL